MEKSETPSFDNYELDKENNKVTLYLNAHIFPLDAIKTTSKQFMPDYWVTIDGSKNSEVLVELTPKAAAKLEGIALTFYNNLVKNAVGNLSLPKDEKTIIQKLSNVFKQFLISERGHVSKQSVVAVSTILATIGLGSVSVNEVTASHMCGGDGGDGGGGGCCLLAGTKITMADGSLKNIEEVQVGERVMSFDEKTRELRPGTVNSVFERMREGYFIINGKLRITDDHPMLVKNEKENYHWAAAEPQDTMYDELDVRKLRIGDEVVSYNENSSGSSETLLLNLIKVKTIEYTKQKIKTYHLDKIEDTKTFFADGFLVHNSDGGGCASSVCGGSGTCGSCGGTCGGSGCCSCF